jgi:serine/threonine-protein kinase
VSAGKYAEACPKFVESQRLDPTAGTLLNIGKCYERIGKTASSWGAYKEAQMVAHGAGDTAREAGAARLAAALEPQLARLVIVVPPEARAPGVEVKRDGALVGEGQWGSPLPVDPGEHVVEVTAPGKQPWRATPRVGAGPGTTTVAIPALAASAPGPVAAAPAPYWNGQRVAGVAVGSAGVAGLIVGAALGAVALSDDRSSKLSCSPSNPDLCTTAGASQRSQAIGLGNGSTAAFAAGGALLVGGIVVFATAHTAKGPQAAVIELVPGVGALALRGRF